MRIKNAPQLAAWLPQIKEPINSYLSRYVRALAAQEESLPPEAWASAVTAIYSGQPILLTAKHVLDRLAGRRLLLEGPNHFQHIPVAPDSLAANEAADAVAIRLPPQSLDWGIQFLVLDMQQEPALAVGDMEIFVAMGFPTRETERHVQQRQLALTSVSYWTFEHHDGCRLLRRSASDCLAIKYDRERSFQYGTQRNLKKPHGMSGGALWRLWGPVTEPPSLSRHALAGVLTEYHESPAKFMLSARVSVAQSLGAQLIRS